MSAVRHLCLIKSQVLWHVPVIPSTQEAKPKGSQVQGQPRQPTSACLKKLDYKH